MPLCEDAKGFICHSLEHSEARLLSVMQDARGHNLWQLTWGHARDISSGLTPQLLTSAGVSAQPASPPRQPPAPAQDTSAATATDAVTAAAPVVAASPLAAALAAAEKQVWRVVDKSSSYFIRCSKTDVVTTIALVAPMLKHPWERHESEVLGGVVSGCINLELIAKADA